MKKSSKKKYILRIILLILIILISIPGYVVFKVIRNDHALNEHVKNNLIPNINKGLKNYFSSEETDSLPVVKLNIGQDEIENLEQQIENKIQLEKNEESIFGKNDFTYVNASIFDNENHEHKIKIRIRGDMSSNFNSGLHNATYRFNVTDSTYFFGKKKLSLVRPFLENHGFYGYLFYKYFKNENLISTDIRFVNLHFNSDDIGVYMLQEGFSEELVTSNNREGGILLRFKDDCANYFNSYSELVPYKKKTVLKDSVLLWQLDDARNKFNDVVDGDKLPGTCFNIESFSKYFALCDIFLSHHSYACWNTKFWFNPNNKLLEPIAWDPANYIRHNVNLDLAYKGHNYTFDSIYNDQYKFPIHYILSKDSSFLSQYTQQLYEYSHNDSIYNFINGYNEQIKRIEPLLFKQNFSTSFHPEWIINRIDQIKNLFESYNVIQASYYKEDSVLKVRSTTELPINLVSMSISDTAIIINKILLPKEELKIRIPIKSDTIKSHKFKLNTSFLFPEEQFEYKGIIF